MMKGMKLTNSGLNWYDFVNDSTPAPVKSEGIPVLKTSVSLRQWTFAALICPAIRLAGPGFLRHLS